MFPVCPNPPFWRREESRGSYGFLLFQIQEWRITNLSRSWFGTVELCVVLFLELGSMWNSALNPPRFQSGKSMVREAIIQIFVTRFPSDFSFFRLFEGAPLSDGHVQVIKYPEYPSDPSLKVSATESKSRCFNFANVANPLVSALPSDFFQPGSKEIRPTERPQSALKIF